MSLFSLHQYAETDEFSAAVYNADRNELANYLAALFLVGYSSDVGQMRQQRNPGGVGSELLATSVADELASLRYVLARLMGTDYWHEQPANTLSDISILQTALNGALTKDGNLAGLANLPASRANLGLGALAILNAINNGNWSGTQLAVDNGGTGATTAAQARANLGLGPTLVHQGEKALISDRIWSITGAAQIIKVVFYLVSSSGSNDIVIRLGTGGTLASTGYISSATDAGTTNTSTSGFIIHVDANAAGSSWTGMLDLALMGSNLWVASGHVYNANGQVGSLTGYVLLPNTCNSVGFDAVGFNSFDGGSARVYMQSE